MKTINDAALEYAELKANKLFRRLEVSIAEKSFKAGVEFAQRWIPVEEELPDEKNGYINKEVIAFTSDNCVYILIYDNYLGWIPNGTDADIDSITNWRPIELK